MSVRNEKPSKPKGPPGKRRPLPGLANDEVGGALPTPESALMRAVLEDAILCYIGRGRRRRIDARILAREAEYWFRCEDWESPFSFNNICDALGLCPSITREVILSWRASDEAPDTLLEAVAG
jgi:hypothetical protein